MTTQPHKDKNPQPKNDRVNLNIPTSLFQGTFSFVAITYAIGFLIINYSYSKYGINVDNISQTRYISVGLLFMTIHAFVAVLYYIAGQFTKQLQKFAGIYKIVFAAILSSVSAGYVFIKSSSVESALWIWLSTSLFLFFVELFWDYITKPDQSHIRSIARHFSLNRTSVLIISTMLGLFFSVVLLYIWTIYMWENISPSVGGGKANIGIIQFDPDKAAGLRLNSVKINTSGTSEPYPILYNTTDEVVILKEYLPDQMIAVKISRSLVQSISYIPSGSNNNNSILGSFSTIPITPTALPTLINSPTILIPTPTINASGTANPATVSP